MGASLLIADARKAGKMSSEFNWELVNADARRAFARAVGKVGRVSDERALEILRDKCPVPDQDFFSNDRVYEAAMDVWLAGDHTALEDVYAADAGRGKPAETDRQKRKSIRNRNRTERLRGQLLSALLASGGVSTDTAEKDKDPSGLARRHVVSTQAGEVSPLFVYQSEVVASLRRHTAQSADGVVHGLVVMPTGSGKTKTAVSWLVGDHVATGGKVLWLTHRQELLRQTAQAFIKEAPALKDRKQRLRLRLIGGGYSAGTTIASDDFDIAVASVGSLSRHMPSVERLLSRDDVIVVLDEAHHATARTWHGIVSKALENRRSVVGLTATPTRMGEDERRALSRLFNNTHLHSIDARHLMARGFLATPHVQRVETRVNAEAGMVAADRAHLAVSTELPPRVAMQLANNVDRTKIVVDTFLHPLGGVETYGPTIVFAVNSAHAEHLAAAFNTAGVRAGVVGYETPNRHATLDQFRDGQLQVLVNVEILTEGVDLPNVRTVFLCRPTQSRVLLSQMVGRALRGPTVGGTKDAYLVSFRDHWEDFPNWLEPIDVLPGDQLPDAEESPDRARVEKRGYDPDQLRAWAEAHTQPAEVGEKFEAIPVGWYSFQTEVSGPDGELEPLHQTVFVTENQLLGYDSFGEATAADCSALPENGDAVRTAFFGDCPNPLPTSSSLSALTHYAREHKALPPFHSLEDRDKLEPSTLAKQIVDGGLGTPTERRDHVAAAAAAAPDLVNELFGGLNSFVEEVLTLVARHEAHRVWPVNVESAPVLEPEQLEALDYGHGVVDLENLLELVCRDEKLFPGKLPLPIGGIAWASRPARSSWATYLGGERIRLNPLLDREDTPRAVLNFLVFHELLHHDNHLKGLGGGHGGVFRQRERLHPDYADANQWLDTWQDHFIVGERVTL